MTAPRKQLRDYQTVGIEQTIPLAMDGKKPLLVIPTGGGKTFVATEMISRMNVRTLWLAHRKELVVQAAKTLHGHGLYTGIIKAGYVPNRMATVQVASIQTLARRNKPEIDLIVYDEAHHAMADSSQKILDLYPNAMVVGLTATPFRLDGRGLGDIFGAIVAPTTTAELCDRGILHRPLVWCSQSPDMKGVKITAGDFNTKQAAERTNTTVITGDIVSHWHTHAVGVKTVCFAVNVEHSRSIVAAFQAAGVTAEHLDGSMPGDSPREMAERERTGHTRGTTRDAVLARLASGVTTIVSNCMVLTEGWDLPALGCAIIARPTASLNLHLQTIGRIMRSCEGKTGCIVLDHAGNHHRHGLVTRPLRYSLESRKAADSEPLGLRRCGKCGLYFETTVFACPACGWVPKRSDRSTVPDVVEGKLEVFKDEWETRCEAWASIESERVAAGYRNGWSFARFEERFGDRPVVIDGELVNPGDTTLANKTRVYGWFASEAERLGHSVGWAAHRYREVFGVWPKGVGVSGGNRERLQERYAEMISRR